MKNSSFSGFLLIFLLIFLLSGCNEEGTFIDFDNDGAEDDTEGRTADDDLDDEPEDPEEPLPPPILEKNGRYSSLSLVGKEGVIYANKWGYDNQDMDLTIWGTDSGDGETIDFPLGWHWNSNGGFVTSYTHIGHGLSPWASTSTMEEFPLRLNTLKKLEVTYNLDLSNTANTAGNTHNLSFDIWLGGNEGPTNGQYANHQTYEIMIWLNRGTGTAEVQPIRNKTWEESMNPGDYNYTASPSVLVNPVGSSHIFRLYRGTANLFTTLSLVSFDFLGSRAVDNRNFWWGLETDTNGKYIGTLDLKHIFDWLITKNLIVENPEDLLLLDVEFGMEIGGGEGELILYDYVLDLEVEEVE